MKKILLLSFLLGCMVMLSAPGVASAAFALPKWVKSCVLKNSLTTIDSTCTLGATIDLETTTGNPFCCFFDAIYSVTNGLFFALVALAAIFTLLGAFNIMTAGGKPEKVTTGRNFIIYAAIGLLCAFLANAIPIVARWLFGF